MKKFTPNVSKDKKKYKWTEIILLSNTINNVPLLCKFNIVGNLSKNNIPENVTSTSTLTLDMLSTSKKFYTRH